MNPPFTPAPAPQPPVPSHMAKAILTTLFCCLPFGIVAIVKASKVDSLLAAGRRDEAIQASKEADNWGNWSILASIIIGVVYALIFAVAAI
ncbi:MAG: CD225/dispanin family protein [Akkermansia sp.]